LSIVLVKMLSHNIDSGHCQQVSVLYALTNNKPMITSKNIINAKSPSQESINKVQLANYVSIYQLIVQNYHFKFKLIKN
jgi:hypothetical protein